MLRYKKLNKKHFDIFNLIVDKTTIYDYLFI